MSQRGHITSNQNLWLIGAQFVALLKKNSLDFILMRLKLGLSLSFFDPIPMVGFRLHTSTPPFHVRA
jgi:hypothetical protein